MVPKKTGSILFDICHPIANDTYGGYTTKNSF